jgi:hypothetical protein
MSKFIKVVFVSLLVLSLESCFDPPVYPDIPEISYKGIRFVQEEGQDSLILSFDFQDGDGDVGLSDYDVVPPYHPFNYIVDAEAKFYYDPNTGLEKIDPATANLVEYGLEATNGPYYLVSLYDTYAGVYSETDFQLPPYSCRDYYFVSDLDGDTLGSDKTDTILIQTNEFANNIIVKFLRKRNGQLEDITESLQAADQCTPPFNSRIPVFNDDNIGRPLRGTIHYPMLSSGFISQFLNDSILIEFYIYDQALNKSNVVTTPAFTLPDLLGIP